MRYSGAEIQERNMEHKDFELTDLELAKINQVLRGIARSDYASEGEPVSDLTVTFAFAVPLGRMISVSVSGSPAVDLDDVVLDPAEPG